jgi:hypothetical protein
MLYRDVLGILFQKEVLSPNYLLRANCQTIKSTLKKNTQSGGQTKSLTSFEEYINLGKIELKPSHHCTEINI